MSSSVAKPSSTWTTVRGPTATTTQSPAASTPTPIAPSSSGSSSATGASPSAALASAATSTTHHGMGPAIIAGIVCGVLAVSFIVAFLIVRHRRMQEEHKELAAAPYIVQPALASSHQGPNSGAPQSPDTPYRLAPTASHVSIPQQTYGNASNHPYAHGGVASTSVVSLSHSQQAHAKPSNSYHGHAPELPSSSAASLPQAHRAAGSSRRGNDPPSVPAPAPERHLPYPLPPWPSDSDAHTSPSRADLQNTLTMPASPPAGHSSRSLPSTPLTAMNSSAPLMSTFPSSHLEKARLAAAERSPQLPTQSYEDLVQQQVRAELTRQRAHSDAPVPLRRDYSQRGVDAIVRQVLDRMQPCAGGADGRETIVFSPPPAYMPRYSDEQARGLHSLRDSV